MLSHLLDLRKDVMVQQPLEAGHLVALDLKSHHFSHLLPVPFPQAWVTDSGDEGEVLLRHGEVIGSIIKN